MGCTGSREKSDSSKENFLSDHQNSEEILRELIMKTEYEAYSFKVREDPEDAFNDILKVWGKLSKAVSENSFPNLSEEFAHAEEDSLESASQFSIDLKAQTPENDVKTLIRKNTIALKNLEITKPDISSPSPTTPKFNFTKLLGDKIQEVVNEDRSAVSGVKKQNSFTGFLGIESKRSNRNSKVSFDLLSKKS